MRRKRPAHRNRPLRRKTHDLKQKPLSRAALKRSPWRRVPASWRPDFERWLAEVTAIGVCLVCGGGAKATDPKKRKPLKLDPHHVLPQRYIRRWVDSQTRDTEEREVLKRRLLYDTRNGVCLCRGCHDAHEKRMRPIPRRLLPAPAFEFVRELDLEWVIERFYPAVA